MSAMRFAHYVLDFGPLAPVVKSARLKGLSQQMFAAKGWLRQAAVLTVRQVLKLHEILRSSTAGSGSLFLDRDLWSVQAQ